MYNFTPLSEEEIDSMNLIKDGVYDFEVVDSIGKTSKSGNQMVQLCLKIYNENGTVQYIYDYLIFSEAGLNIRKIKHFCEAVGLEEDYKLGRLPEELANYSGKLQIGTQEKKPKEGGGFYPKKSIVVDYIKSDKTNQSIKKIADEPNDEVPF